MAFFYFYQNIDCIAVKISTVFRKLIRGRGFSMYWRVGDITIVSEFGSANALLISKFAVWFLQKVLVFVMLF